MIKLSHTLIALIAIVILSACGGQETDTSAASSAASVLATSQSKSLPTYETIKASPQDQKQQVNITGRIVPLEKIQLVAEVQGKALATSRLLNEGVRYRKGETLIRIEDTQTQLNLQAQKSQFQSALVRIMSQVKLDYPKAHPAWDTYLRALDVSKPLPDLPEIKNEQLRFFLSANNIFSSFYNIKSSEELLSKYRITAPFTGVITQGNIAPGAVINPGVPLASFSRTDVYELKASVSTANIEKLKPGSKITLSHSNTGDEWTGTIHRFGGNIDPATQAVPIYIRLSGNKLREGMFLEAALETETYEDVVSLPLTALNRNNQVHVIQDSTVVLKNVDPVHYEQQIVWVKGLEEGTEVITEEVIQPIVGIKAIAKS